MFRAPLCPSSGVPDRILLYMDPSRELHLLQSPTVMMTKA